MSKYLLPKPHLSWSAMDLWEKNKERFKREYFASARRLDTRYLQFGKKIAKLVEELCEAEKRLGSKEAALEWLKAEHELDDDAITALRKLDTDGVSEYSIGRDEVVYVRDVPILSYIDKYKPEPHVFREYKTGKNPWDRPKVQKHGQLVFYATALKAKLGEMPSECWLDWLETSEESEEPKEEHSFWKDDTSSKKLALTGRVESFHRVFFIQELEKMEERIERAAIGIDAAYREFISEI